MPLRLRKLAQPRDIARRRRADQHRAAGAGLNQADAPQDQRSHDLLAERGLGDQQGMQLLRADEQRSTSPTATASTSERRPESCPSSPEKAPAT